MDAVIIDRGRGPEIAGTRITVFDVLDYLQAGWDDKGIAVVLSLGTDQVRAAREYIDNHPGETQAEFHQRFPEEPKHLQDKDLCVHYFAKKSPSWYAPSIRP